MLSFVGMCCHKISCKFLVLHINNKYFHGIILSSVLNFASSHKQCAGSFLLLYMSAVSGYDIMTDGGWSAGFRRGVETFFFGGKKSEYSWEER